ncbi:MAG: hypothetical protein ACM3UW_05345 [Bacillota bacterium]
MRTRKLQCLLYMLLFCLALCSSALAADTKNLIAWSNNPPPQSSDPANTADYLDPGNPNQPSDVAMLDCSLVDDHHIQVTIGPNPDKKGGAYPGYQASFTSRVVNTTNEQVKITGVEISQQPAPVLLRITDTDGNELVGQVLNANESIPVVVTTRVKQSAIQMNRYDFMIRIDAVQEAGGPPYDPPSPPSYDPDPLPGPDPEPPVKPEEPIFIPQTPEPLAPQQKQIDLPYTGGNAAWFIGSGLTLGCLGLMLRNRQ